MRNYVKGSLRAIAANRTLSDDSGNVRGGALRERHKRHGIMWYVVKLQVFPSCPYGHSTDHPLVRSLWLC